MDTLPLLKFDIRGEYPDNFIKGEEIPLDPTCPWVIPNGSPFFGDYPKPGQQPLTVVYDEAGRILNRDKDYWLEEEFIPLTDVTGRPIYCFIRTSEEVRAVSKKIKVNYLSVGAYFIPRNNLKEWMDKISRGSIPIDFNEKVLGIPDTVPAEWHSHSGKTEVGDWFELTLFFTYLTENLKTRKGGEINDQLEVASDAAFARLRAERDSAYAKLRAHQDDYNKPHGILPKHVNLGNHPNYATASLQQDLEGDRDDLLSTPQGVQELIKANTPNTDGAMRNGLLPLSKYGRGHYIPPAITGSFEGLGSGSECMGMCVEPDGRCIVLQSHNDGRNTGLYFSTLDNYSSNYDPNKPYEFKYSSYQYEPPVLKNVGIVPNHIIAGSGNDVIMVGVTTHGNPAANDRWFLALTNNSFDPASHRYIATNMSKIFAQCGNPDEFGEWPNNKYHYHGRMSVSLVGEWVVLAVDYPSTQPSIYNYQGRMSYWKIPKSALVNGTPATWEVMNLTYRDYDNVLYTNLNYWEFAKKTVANAKVSKWGRYTFTKENPPQRTGYFGRRILTFFAKKPGTTNIFYMNWLAYTFLETNMPDRGRIDGATITNMVYELNVDTGAMTLIYKQPPLDLDYTGVGWPPGVVEDREQYMEWYDSLVRYTYPATVVLENGDVLSAYTAPGQEIVRLNTMIRYFGFRDVATNISITNKADLFKGNLSKSRIRANRQQQRYRSIQTPIPIGIWSRYTTYETTGENFLTYPTVVDHNVGYGAPKVVCRNVTGPYAVRPQVFNFSLSPLYSRPLSNDVWDTNMTFKEGVIGITGTNAELASRGVECGNMSLSSCGMSNKHDTLGSFYLSFPDLPFQATNKTGALLTFPKTYTRTPSLIERKMLYTPTSFYGISSALRDKIRTLIPASQRGEYWSFSIFMLNAETGGMFAGLNSAIIYIKYPTNTNNSINTSWDCKVFHVRPTVVAPNASHPGCHLITDFTILGQSVAYVAHRNVTSTNLGTSVQPTVRPSLNIYRNGNTLSCKLYSGFSTVSGSFYQDFNSFQVNVSTGVVNNVGGFPFAGIFGNPITNIPGVGPTKFTLNNPDTYDATIGDYGVAGIDNSPSGGAAEIFNVGNNYYATITGYPESSWSVFILEEVEVLLTGTLYKMPMGTIDLRDIDTDPRDKMFYLYATIEGQRPQYVISSTKLRQTSKLLLAAEITTGPNQIMLIERRQPFLIGDLETAYSRAGGTIPVSSGFPQDEGNFTFLRASELLP